MSEFLVKILQVGALGTNCSLLVNRETGEAVIVDPGDEAKRILSELSALGARPTAILLTHAHHDHTMAIEELLELCGPLPVAACEKEREMFEDRSLNCSTHGGRAADFMPDTWLADGDRISYAGARLRVLETPGHTAGSVCFYIDQPATLLYFGEEIDTSFLLFAGDTLFYRSYGRTDFPTSSEEAMWSSLKRLLTELPEETVVIPGHGQLTLIGYERKVKGIQR